MKDKFASAISLALVLTILVSSNVLAAVWTDQEEYAPGSVVTLSGDNRDGAGYQAGETVLVEVSGPNGYTATCTGVADANGGWSCQVTLWGTELAVGDYTYTATGQSSGVSQGGTFTDGSGAGHTCALTSSGGVKCWGGNLDGQLGNGSTANSATPVDVSGLSSGVAQVSTGGQVSTDTGYTCALMASGGLKCWGNNSLGQLGNGSTTSSATPVDVSGLNSGVAQISAGVSHACALTTSGGVKCWGRGLSGELGNGSTTNSTAPVDVSGLSSGVAQISAGGGHTCALMTSGGVKCWGYNAYGQLGDGSTTNSATPVDVSGLSSGVAQISSGGNYSSSLTCALMTSGGIKCWGSNFYGQFGNGSLTSSLTPVDVSGLGGIAQISMGGTHTCALTTSGGVKCWGYNFNGQLGNGSTGFTTPPVDVVGLSSGVSQVSASSAHTCALTSSGGVKCWGNNFYGQVGNGTFTTITPFAVATPGDVVGLTSGVVDLPDTLGLVISDSTPPVITPSVSGTLGNNGWYTSDVAVTWGVVENESSISSQSGCGPATVSADTAGITLTCTATSAGGTASASITIQRDASAPVLLSASVSPNPVTLNASASASATWDAGLSGLASQSCDPVVTSSVGSTSVNCRATDNAGNQASASVPYQVIYSFSEFLQPVDAYPTLNVVKAGQSVPVKFSLNGDQGLSIFAPGYPASTQIPCSATATNLVEETVAASASRLNYDATTDQYNYIWKTEKAWANTCRTLTIVFVDGTFHQANFQFKQ